MNLDELTMQICAATTKFKIAGGGSKTFYGSQFEALPTLDTTALQGIVSYEPKELVMQVRAGTRLTEVKQSLDSMQQMLAFDPPSFTPDATVGGMVATGIAGSRRPFSGAVRDFVLGVDIIDGMGRQLSFGGQVMKNVAGYDVSRLMVGAMGSLGLISEVSFKVLPKPELEMSICLSLSKQDGLQKMLDLRRQSNLLSAAAYYKQQLYLRFSGATNPVRLAIKNMGGEAVTDGFWLELDNLSLFDRSKNLWRYSCDLTDPDFIETASIIDWCGGQRWIESDGENFRDQYANNLGTGYLTLVRRGFAAMKSKDEVFAPLGPVLKNLHSGLKKQFDPKGIFNPSVMYADI